MTLDDARRAEIEAKRKVLETGNDEPILAAIAAAMAAQRARQALETPDDPGRDP